MKNGIDTWERLSLDDEELLSGASLSQALEWRKRNPAALNERELRFIEASERRQKELRPTPLVEPLPSRATRRRAPVVLVVIGVAALLSIGWFALFNRSKESTPPGQSSPAPKISQQTLADSLIDSGKLDMEKGAYDSALTKFSSALELQPASTAALMNRASAYSKLGKTDESIADYSKLLATDPENADAYNFRGSGYLKAKQYDKAIADFSQALRRKNRLIDAYLGRAAAYRSKGDTGKAYDDLTTARLLSSDPKTLATIDRSLTEIEAARLRIIPHYSSPSEEKLAQAIATALRGQGYRVDKPQEISTSSPSGIRYFFQEDKKRAEEISVIIPNIIKDRRIQGLHVIYIQTQATVERGTIEIWLPAGPGYKQY